MATCGKSTDLEALKGSQAELESLMSNPASLSSMESKVSEMSGQLNSFKPTVTPVPNLQRSLAELGSINDPSAMQSALTSIKQTFGGVVDNLGELISAVSPQISSLLEVLPDASLLSGITDGSLKGDALTKALQEKASAEALVAQKLAVGGLPSVSTASICSSVPNIEVQSVTKTVTENGVTTQYTEPTKVELPPEPVIPKTVPETSPQKPAQKSIDVDAQGTARGLFVSARKNGFGDFLSNLFNLGSTSYGSYLKGLSESEKASTNRLVMAHKLWFYTEVAKVIGVADHTKVPLTKRTTTLKEAQELVPESNRKDVWNSVKSSYDRRAVSLGLEISYEEAVNLYYSKYL